MPKKKAHLDNSLQLPGIAQCIFNNFIALQQAFLLTCSGVDTTNTLRIGEVYPTIFQQPTSLFGEFDHGTFAVEEEKVLGI